MSAMPAMPAAVREEGRIVVGVAELVVTGDPSSSIVTHALGSCVGVTIYDPVAKVAGLLHFMLPHSKVNPEKAAVNPAMFGDTGIPLLFKSCYELGGEKERMIVCAAGGAEVLTDDGHFRIGSRNRTILRKIFWKNKVMVSHEEVGGNVNRTVKLAIKDGSCWLKVSGKEEHLV